MAWVMLPLDPTARSRVMDGMTTTDSSSWLSRIASQTPAIRAWSWSKRRYRSSSDIDDSTLSARPAALHTRPVMTMSVQLSTPLMLERVHGSG